MANSVDEWANESFSHEPIVFETPQMQDYDENVRKCDQINFMYRQQPSNIVGSTMLDDIASV